MRRQDIYDINQEMTEVRDAFDRLEELARLEANGSTITDAEYDEAQTRLKEAFSTLWAVADQAIETTDTIESDAGDVLARLPQQAAAKDRANAPGRE